MKCNVEFLIQVRKNKLLYGKGWSAIFFCSLLDGKRVTTRPSPQSPTIPIDDPKASELGAVDKRSVR